MDTYTGEGLFLRTLLKESLQNYVLNFIYNDRLYQSLIFTGGTCLRKIYGLPRLSEDLDFNFVSASFDVPAFSGDLVNYFKKTLAYEDLSAKITGNGRSVLLKFQILKKLGLFSNSAESDILFLRCDLAAETGNKYKTEVKSLSTSEWSLFALAYDLPTQFANKIAAFLERVHFKGSEQKIPFKGRDVFDLMWFFEQNLRDPSFGPNWPQVEAKLQKSRPEILRELITKTALVDRAMVKADLRPFLGSAEMLEKFGDSYEEIITAGAKKLLV